MNHTELTNLNWKRNIALFLTSQTISLFGSSLVQYAIMWYITLTTQSGIMMTISIICGFLPAFFLSPFAGVWADRYNRKMLIMLSDSMIALATLILAILFLNGYDSMWLLFVMYAIRAIGTGIQMPAVGAILPQIVPEDKLTKVNGINGSIQALIMLISPMASAALLSFTTIEFIFFVDVITAAIAVLTLLLFLKIPIHTKAQEQQTTTYFNDFKEGLEYINNHAFLKKYFIFFGAFFILAAPASFLTPLQVTRTFGANEWYLSAIEIAFSIGMIVGGGLMASWGGFKNKTHTMTLSAIIFGICTLLFGVVPVFWLYLIFMGLAGVIMPMFNTPATVLIQEKVEANFLGRVFGVLTMISTSMMPLGMLVYGPLADIVAIEWLLIVSGLLIFILSFFLLSSKELIEAGKPSIEQ
ncbi:DHA3 family macrolide efflux protein-like MFS transporter [Ureibacillus xyleni]|uniref:DHA3 family macrolide efflux protein-like MFS transporter n=1 Tax=Ureibacillus xyleni TaxID=614648 RepID=A0A285T9I1_9BACL|nr:MFS transporter [Ureibacillus xyleni]SOC18157.1 DHA3 family macrolide efflux protein-like MFS transporter [Ureibacillus xyleni]